MNGVEESSLSLRYPLNLQLFAGEKTEKATPKKRQDTRKKGQVAKSMDVSGAVVLLSSFFCLLIFGGYMKDHLIRLFKDVLLNRMNMTLSVDNVVLLLGEYGIDILIMLAPLLAAVMVMALAANLVQVGFLLTGEPLKMKLSKLDPIKGFKNIFSMKSLVEFLKTIFKLLIIGYLVYTTLWGQKEEMSDLSLVSVEAILYYTAGMTLSLGLKIGVALFILSIVDYMFKRYDHEKEIRMSKQDIKDEYKKMEGDPLIKGKIRERQRRMALQRMMQEIPKADVIITNPTHFAVALQYDGSSMEAPQIIAKGQDYVALRIREIAKEHGVMIMENKPLARALYSRAEIGDQIPADLFQAVAEVLSYVYKLKGKVK